MKSFAPILAIYLFLFSVTPLIQEVSKINLLLSHYGEHLTEEKEMSFLDFLQLHYGDQEHDVKNPHDDLPFHHKHQHQCQHLLVTSVFTLTPAFCQIFKFDCLDIVEIKISRPRFFTLSNYPKGIWQPPKI